MKWKISPLRERERDDVGYFNAIYYYVDGPCQERVLLGRSQQLLAFIRQKAQTKYERHSSYGDHVLWSLRL